MKLFQVKARRSGEWWALSVEDLPGVHSQVRSLVKAEAAIKEAIALVHDWDPNEFAVAIPDLGDDKLYLQVITSRQKIAEAEAVQQEAAAASRAAAKALLDKGPSQRDAAQVMGLSFQRVSQLVS